VAGNESKRAPLKRGRGRTREPGEAVRTLDRGLALLEALGQAQELTLTEAADRAGLAPSTALRLLETLHLRGFVTWDRRTGRYGIGLRAFELGMRFLARGGLSEAAHSVMHGLVDKLGETVNLAIRDGRDAVYVYQAEGKQRVRMFTQIGARAPLHASGVGKVLLAWNDGSGLEECLALPLEAYTQHTLVERDVVLAELERIRSRGYALDMEEFELGVRCVAVPIRVGSGEVIAGLSISAPLSRMADERLDEIAEELLMANRQISSRLGWTAPAQQARVHDVTTSP
jgi:DNA-binding IclR family transcriptional regulator